MSLFVKLVKNPINAILCSIKIKLYCLLLIKKKKKKSYTVCLSLEYFVAFLSLIVEDSNCLYDSD
jgi:hypothetical protein